MAKMPQCHLACLRRPNSAAKRAALRMETGVRMFFFWERAGMSGRPGGGASGAAGERGRAMEGLSMPDDGRGLWGGPIPDVAGEDGKARSVGRWRALAAPAVG